MGVFVAGNGSGWSFSMEWSGYDCHFGSQKDLVIPRLQRESVNQHLPKRDPFNHCHNIYIQVEWLKYLGTKYQRGHLQLFQLSLYLFIPFSFSFLFFSLSGI